MLKIDIGGGHKPKAGHVNIDMLVDGINLEKDLLPFDDNSVDEIYSSHCFEHIRNMKHLINEVVRVAKPGARVEIWTPHYTNPMAMCFGHVVVWSEMQWLQITKHFKTNWFSENNFIEFERFEYGNMVTEHLPGFDYKYYHDFAMIGKVVKS